MRRFYGERRRLLDQREGSLVLDVPCGAGALFPTTSPSTWAEPCYVAVDLSTLMLARARRAAAARGLQRVHLVRADAHRLPFVTGAFDLVLTHNGLHCYAEPSGAVRELARVVKPGGTVRGSAIVAGAGRRPDLVIRAALRLGMFQTRLRPGKIAAWLCEVLDEVRVEPSGAVSFFSARRGERS